MPEFISERCDVSMAECSHAVSGSQRLSMLMQARRAFERLPGVLVCGEVILFSLLLANTMCVRGAVV